uniref:Gag protein n=1 Tax=Ditylenchus dipsaci TaxID=166011 RepID=A0A915D1M0_9BILA
MIITQTMPKKEFNALKSNLNTTRLGLIEFRVNVTLSLNGLYTMNQMKQVLSAQELDNVSGIQEGASSNEEKATAIGQILRKAYSRNPKAVQDQWPAIFGSNQFPEDLKRATTYMLFNENPSRDMTPFAKVFRQAFLQMDQMVGKEDSEKRYWSLSIYSCRQAGSKRILSLQKKPGESAR